MSKYSVNKLPSDILKLVAKNIVALRKEKGLTQLDLAEKSGVSYGSIKRFERLGKISFESLLMIAESLNRLEDFETILTPRGNKHIEQLFNSSL